MSGIDGVTFEDIEREGLEGFLDDIRTELVSYTYRPKRTAHQAVARVAQAIVERKTRVIDLDLKSYFDTVRHDLLLRQVAARVQDDQALRLLKMILKPSGKRGVPQGGVISPLLANLYLNEVDKMLERAKEVTREGGFSALSIPTSGPGDRPDQPYLTWLGLILPYRQFQWMFWLRPRLGRKENSAPPDACEESAKLRLDTVE